MIRFIFTKKHTYWDLFCVAAAMVLASNHMWWWTLFALVVGSIISVEMEGHILIKETEEKIALERFEEEMEKLANDQRDKLWQGYAKTGQFVAAIKEHRTAYGSSLYDAKQAVDAYMQKESYRRNTGDW